MRKRKRDSRETVGKVELLVLDREREREREREKGEFQDGSTKNTKLTHRITKETN